MMRITAAQHEVVESERDGKAIRVGQRVAQGWLNGKMAEPKKGDLDAYGGVVWPKISESKKGKKGSIATRGWIWPWNVCQRSSGVKKNTHRIKALSKVRT